MIRKPVSFTVTLVPPPRVFPHDMKGYILTAVQSEKGHYPPESPLFDLDPDTISVRRTTAPATPPKFVYVLIEQTGALIKTVGTYRSLKAAKAELIYKVTESNQKSLLPKIAKLTDEGGSVGRWTLLESIVNG